MKLLLSALYLSVLIASTGFAEDTAVVWRTDFQKTLSEALTRNIPLFVTFRCLPCKQCAAFDKDVLEGSPALTPLLRQFLTVRLTDAAQLDERYFPYRTHQDLDLSWWGYVLSPEGNLYGVFGGKDHISDETRISEAALVTTLLRILAYHQAGGTDFASIASDRNSQAPKDLAAFSSYTKTRPHVEKQACLHCHQVADVLITESIENNTFAKPSLKESWPLPENLGLVLDRDNGLLVTRVDQGGAAQKAGLQQGDTLSSADQTRLFSQADFRGVLHRAKPGETMINLIWMRGDTSQSGELVTTPGWKSGQNWWRKSVSDGVYGPYLGFFPLEGKGRDNGSLSIRPYMGKDPSNNPWWQTGLRPGQEIVSISGRRDDWSTRELLTWFRANFEAGDEVQLIVKENGKERAITGTAPAPK